MSNNNKTYKVNIGLSIVPNETEGFADFGLTYHNMDKLHIATVESVFDKYADEIVSAMKGLRKELIELGFTEASGK